MSNYQTDSTDAGKQQWISNALEARQQCQDMLTECSVPSIPNTKCYDVPRAVMALHSGVLNYHSTIAPKFQDGQGIKEWDQDLTYVEVPKPGTYPAGRTDRWGEFNVSGEVDTVPREEWPVNPSTLVKRWRGGNEVRLTFTLDGGRTTETVFKAVYLTPAASSVLIDFLDSCLEELGWLPDSSEKAIGGKEAGVLSHDERQ